ncbi:MAG: DNA helicase RecQ [Lachnospiraceae bacterium]|nr:DNA helicase RecQ [Ruminococcus sp.]MCM1275302.1 DNA helicase RecQ [Lachnospiraceae bacterium]
MTKLDVLRKYFGHGSFREGQEQLIDNILGGRDVLGVMPTGAGKSMCYQIPAMLLNGTVIVISPLISLMRDQVEALVQNGVSAACINSSQDSADSREVFGRAARGEYDLLYVAPERLETESFLRLCGGLEIPLVAVDEAHCVSQWGQDFRPSYLGISRFVKSLKKRPVIGAFTATATEIVKRDIAELLGLNEPFAITTGFDRPNLYFEVRKPEDKDEELLKILRGGASGSAIVYCATRKNVESVCDMLQRNGFSAGRYHAGFSPEQRRAAQDDFLFDRVDVMVATNAFGMGIDKSNVSLVVHYNMPKDIESYYQEAGRAGRDGGDARCILLYGYSDVALAEFMIKNSPRTDAELEKRDTVRLRKMQSYVGTSGCLRAFILRYFGEKSKGACGNCGNCLGDYETVDITLDAQKILSCIYRLKQRNRAVGKALVCRILLGSKDKRILDEGYDTLSTYGIMSGVPRARVRDIMGFLEGEGYFEVGGEYSVCVLTPKADEFIRSGRALTMRLPKAAGAAPSARKADAERPNPELFERLRELRKKTARALGVPPYVVFSDAVLWNMCARLPRTHEELLGVSGVGSMKAERYGRKFLAVINEFLRGK